MVRLLLNEKLKNKSRQPGESKFLTIFKLFKRIVQNNKLLFFNCSLLACLTAIINFVANSLVDQLFLSKPSTSSTPVQNENILLSFKHPFKFGGYYPLGRYVSWLIVYLLLFKGTFSIMHWYATTYGPSKIEKDLKTELFEVLTSSNYEKSSEISPRMLTQFSSDIDSIAGNIWTIPNRLIYVGVSVFLYIYFNFRRDGQFKYVLILIISLLFASLFAIIFFLLRKSIRLGIEAKKRYEKDNRFIFERISNLEYIKSTSSEELEKKKINDHLSSTLRKNRLSLLWTVLFRSVPDYLVIPNIPLLFIWIVTLNDFFTNQVGSMAVLTTYLFTIRRLNNEVNKIFNSLLSLEDLSSDLSIVMDSVNALTEGESSGHQESVAFSAGNITFDKVTFAYPSRTKNVLEDFSFTFEKGKRYGIAGKNGIGKSTVTRILLKLYRASSGSVLVNQRNLSEIKTVELHRSICKLNNRPSFFNMSVAENIFYPFTYNKSRDLGKLTRAAKEARIFNFIRSLPAGFDTVLRGGGADLSEGQKQQLEAMKVFVRSYEIYIFDEILSNVHPLTRKVILKSIFANIKNKLVIAIDHHYDIFIHMDYVYTFSSKKLIRVRHPEKLLGSQYTVNAGRKVPRA